MTAGLMTGHVRRVAVRDANGEHVRRLREPGLRLDVLGTERIVPLEGYRSVAELDGRFVFGLVTLKAQNLKAALPGVVERGLVKDFVGLATGSWRIAGRRSSGATAWSPAWWNGEP